MNLQTQYYKNIPLNLINDGTIKPGENLDYIFTKTKRQCEIAFHKNVQEDMP